MKNKKFNFNNEKEQFDIVEYEDGRITIEVGDETVEFSSIQEFAEFYAGARGVEPENFKNWHLSDLGDQYIYSLKAGTAGCDDEDDYSLSLDDVRDYFDNATDYEKFTLYEYYYKKDGLLDKDEVISKYFRDYEMMSYESIGYDITRFADELINSLNLESKYDYYAYLVESYKGVISKEKLRNLFLAAKVASRDSINVIVKSRDDQLITQKASISQDDIDNYDIYELNKHIIAIKKHL